MAEIEVDYEIVFVSNKLPALIAAVPEKVGRAVYRTVIDIERDAKKLCPVDTGRLRASIHGQMTGPTDGVVGTNVEYAKDVELGHHTDTGAYVPGRPYLGQAVTMNKAAFQQRMTDLLKAEGLLL